MRETDVNRGRRWQRFALAALAGVGIVASVAPAATRAAPTTRRASRVLTLPPAGNVDASVVDGIQPAALDQPRIRIELRRSPSGPALAAAKTSDAKAMEKLMGPMAGGAGEDSLSEITAFLDTGASGLLLSAGTAKALGVRTLANTTFEDVGVAGSDAFSVSEPLYVALPGTPALKATGKTVGNAGRVAASGSSPLRAQVSRKAGMLEQVVGDLDVAGMPVLAGRVIVLDPTPVDQLAGTLNVSFPPAAPATRFRIKLTPRSFRAYTRTTPAENAPTMADNPLIEGVTVSLNGKRVTGTFLLDTGAAASMISTRLAAQLGLPAKPANPAFSLAVGGIGGQTTSPGIFLDTLTLPTADQRGLTFRKAPVLINDITLVDATTKEQLTLDGVFGMNFLCGSAKVQTAGAMPDIQNITPSPFKVIVIDLKSYQLGLTLK